MELEDTEERESLEAWLKGRSREDGVWIAHRAAMRVLPLCKTWRRGTSTHSVFLTGLPILRALLVSEVGAEVPTLVVRRAAEHAASAASSFTEDNLSASYDTDTAGNFACKTIVYGCYAAVVSGGDNTGTAVNFAHTAETFSYDSADNPVRGVFSAASWSQINTDRKILQSDIRLDLTPLWSGEPNLFQSEWNGVRNAWQANPDYAFWLRWYEAALAGNPPNWPLLHDIALIPNADWEKGITHIAGVIVGIELQYAIAATPNGERIVINPATGLLRLETVSELPADHLADALDMMRDAQSIFDDKGKGNHPYETIADERALIDWAIEQYFGRPRMIYNSCMRVIRRIEIKKSTGDCPSNDSNIDDYQGQLGSIAVKLMTHDTEVKASVVAETETRLNAASPAQRAQILAGATAVAEISEGILKEELPAIAAVAADPKADGKDRGIAIYQTASRLLRVASLKNVGLAASGHAKRHVEVYSIALALAALIAGFIV